MIDWIIPFDLIQPLSRFSLSHAHRLILRVENELKNVHDTSSVRRSGFYCFISISFMAGEAGIMFSYRLLYGLPREHFTPCWLQLFSIYGIIQLQRKKSSTFEVLKFIVIDWMWLWGAESRKRTQVVEAEQQIKPIVTKSWENLSIGKPSGSWYLRVNWLLVALLVPNHKCNFILRWRWWWWYWIRK